MLRTIEQAGPTSKRRLFQPHEVLKISPLLCGTWKYYYQDQLQRFGVQLVNDTNLIAAAHLYNCLQQNKFLEDADQIEWIDLEHFLSLHRVEDAFAGDRPKSIEACTRRLAIVQGVSAKTFARGRRSGQQRIIRSSKGRRLLKSCTPLTNALGERYMHDEAFSLDAIDQKNRSEIYTIITKRMKALCVAQEKWESAQKPALDTLQGINNFCKYAGELPMTQEQFDIFLEKVQQKQRQRADEKQKLDGLLAKMKAQDASLNPNSIVEMLGTIFGRKPQAKTSEHASDTHETASEETEESASKDAEATTSTSHANVPAHPMWPAQIGERRADPDEDNELEGHFDLSNLDPERLRREYYGGPYLPSSFESLCDGWKATRRLTMEKYVSFVSDILMTENPSLGFDYFAFFRHTFKVMLDMQDALLPVLGPIYQRFNHSTGTAIPAEEYDLFLDATRQPWSFGPLYERDQERVNAIIIRNGHPIAKALGTPGGAMLIPNLALVAACDIIRSPSLFVIKPSPVVDRSLLETCARILRPWLHDHAATCVDLLETQTKARTKRITDPPRSDETGWTGLRNFTGADNLEVGTLRAQALASMARAKARFPGLYPRVDFEREERRQARRDAGEAVDSESDIYSDSD